MQSYLCNLGIHHLYGTVELEIAHQSYKCTNTQSARREQGEELLYIRERHTREEVVD